jgi:hypothetical protein
MVDSSTRKVKVERKERLIDRRRVTKGERGDEGQLGERKGSACSQRRWGEGVEGKCRGESRRRTCSTSLRPSVLLSNPRCTVPRFGHPRLSRVERDDALQSSIIERTATTAWVAPRLAPSGLRGVQKVLVVATEFKERIEVLGRSTTFPSSSPSTLALRLDTRSPRYDLYAAEGRPCSP